MARACPAFRAVRISGRQRSTGSKTAYPPPRYALGRVGMIEALRGCHVFPDSVAIGEGKDPQWLYTVRVRGLRKRGVATSNLHCPVVRHRR
jgi:hypothetical protein